MRLHNAARAPGMGHLVSEELALERLREFAAAGQLYAVIDACDTPAVPEKARELGDSRAVSLYRGSADEMYWAFAPYLFVVDGDLLDWIVADLWTEPWGIFAVADKDLEAVRRHFRRFLLVRSPDGEQWYFRFYDPRVLKEFLSNGLRGELRALFGSLRMLGIPHADPFTAQFWHVPTPGVKIRLHSQVSRLIHSTPAGTSNPVESDRLAIRSSLYEHFASVSFHTYLQRLVQLLGSLATGSDFFVEVSEAALLDDAKRFVAEAEQLGFAVEDDVTAFVLLRVFGVTDSQDSGMSEWIEAILTNREVPAEHRLNAVFEILPEVDRDRIFSPLSP
jgi:Domain of unknown function (DUF4123)